MPVTMPFPRAVALMIATSLSFAPTAFADTPSPATEATADDETSRVEIELGGPDGEDAPAAESSRQSGPSVAIAIEQRSDRPPRDGGGGSNGKPDEDEPERILHGFRLGYLYLNNYDEPTDPADPESSLARKHDIRSPHQFLIGYEVADRLTNQGWLNVIVVGNAMIGGLEQSKFFPSANLLLGFEFRESFQLGVGVNLVPVRDKAAHMITVAGWTPKVGELYLPVHFFFIPDVDSNFRMGATVGVNWGA